MRLRRATATAALATLSIWACGTAEQPALDPGQPARTAGAACSAELPPARQEFRTAISRAIGEPEDSVRITRLKR